MQLKLWFSVCVLSALAVFGAECRNLPAADHHQHDNIMLANNSAPCNLTLPSICTAMQDSDQYALQIDMSDYNKTGDIHMNVSTAECSFVHSPLPWWFQVEALEKLTTSAEQDASTKTEEKSAAGKFQMSRRKHEMSLCEGDLRAVFSTCSPMVLDIPRFLIFHPDSKYSQQDTLCFRLTLQHAGESSCHQKEACVDLPMTPKKSHPIPHPMHTVVMSIRKEPKHSNDSFPEVGSGVRNGFEVDGSEGIDSEGDDDSDADIEAAIAELRKKIPEMTIHTEVKMPMRRGCFQARNFYKLFDSWVPECDCNGDYKPVQCHHVEDELQCWCSTPSGSEIYGSRRTISCTNPQSLEFC